MKLLRGCDVLPARQTLFCCFTFSVPSLTRYSRHILTACSSEYNLTLLLCAAFSAKLSRLCSVMGDLHAMPSHQSNLAHEGCWKGSCQVASFCSSEQLLYPNFLPRNCLFSMWHRENFPFSKLKKTNKTRIREFYTGLFCALCSDLDFYFSIIIPTTEE